MVNNAEQTARNAEADQFNLEGMCLQQVRMWADIPAMHIDAATAWAHTVHRHPGDFDPPRGAAVYWTGGSGGHGHIALSLGGRKIRTTDGDGPGRVATRPLSWPTESWGLPYAGWAWDINGVTIPHDEQEDEMTENDWKQLRTIVAEEVRKLLFEPVDDRKPDPTTVKKSLRLSADHARGYKADG
jgi:hypothetical protein